MKHLLQYFNVIEVKPTYNENPEWLMEELLLEIIFIICLNAIPEAMIFGEDVGKIGGVNQGCEGITRKIWRVKSC